MDLFSNESWGGVVRVAWIREKDLKPPLQNTMPPRPRTRESLLGQLIPELRRAAVRADSSLTLGSGAGLRTEVHSVSIE